MRGQQGGRAAGRGQRGLGSEQLLRLHRPETCSGGSESRDPPGREATPGVKAWLPPEAAVVSEGHLAGRIPPKPQFWGLGWWERRRFCRTRPQTLGQRCTCGVLGFQPFFFVIGHLVAVLEPQDVQAPAHF